MFSGLWPAGGRVALCGAFITGVLLAVSADRETLAAAANAAPAIPDFEVASDMGWYEFGDMLLPPPNGPGPVTQDPKYPFNFRLNYRVADTGNPSCSLGRRSRWKKPMRQYWREG